MKIKFLFLVSFILIYCTNKKSNELLENKKSQKDSIAFYLTRIKEDKLSPKIRVINAKKLYNNLNQSENSKKNRENLFLVSEIFYKFNELDYLNISSKELLKRSKKVDDSSSLGKSLNLRGKYQLENGFHDSAFYYFTKAEKILHKVKDTVSLSINYINKANVQLLENDFSGSEQSSFIALKYLDDNDLVSKYNIYNYIGYTSAELENYDNSLIYYEKALELSSEDQLKEFELEASCLNNLGFHYQRINNHKRAIEYFKSAMKVSGLSKKDPYLYAMLTDNYAYSKFKSNDYSELPSLFYVSLKIREANNFEEGVITNKIHLSEYYNFTKEFDKSKKFAFEALELAKKRKISGNVLLSLKQLSNIDEKNAVKYTKEYIRLSDSVQNEERKAKDRFARIAYETDEVIQKNTELEVKNRYLVIFLFGAIAIFFLLYAVRTQKMRNRELAFKQEQQENNRQIYNLMITQQEKVEAASAYEKNKMAQELHDGVLSKMFGTRMNLDSLNDAKDEASISMRYDYIQALKSIEQEIREISHDLSSEKGKLINNFVNIVIDLLEEQKKSFEPEIIYSIDKPISWDRLDNTAKINLYRILQESLQNSNKYAKAKTINVTFTQVNENVVLKIEDDGDGFDLAKKKKGIGLKNMISRTEESNGIYEIISEQGTGTTTTVSIPLTIQTPTQIA